MIQRFTVNDFAEKNNLNRDHAYGLLDFLEKVGKIRKNGTIPAATGKGRGQNVYEGDPSEVVAYISKLTFPNRESASNA